MVGAFQVHQGLWRALGRPPKQSPILFTFLPQCVFGQPGSGECGWGAYWRTCRSVGIFEAWSILKWEIALHFRNGRWGPLGEEHEVMLVERDLLRPWEWFAVTSGSVKIATLCCWLNQKMFLVFLDGDRVLGKNGVYCWVRWIALLSLWEHTWKERWQKNET